MKQQLKKPTPYLIALLVLATASTVTALYLNRPFRTRLAAYTTDLRARSEAQRTNIQRVGKKISGIILPSGQTFSLNQQAGPYTVDEGFLPERTYMGDELVMTPGGGVCQVASTLYNTAEAAGMTIIERIPHSGPVASVPKGRDATVAYGVADLKFSNPHPYPVKIFSRIRNDQLIVEVWGKERPDEFR